MANLAQSSVFMSSDGSCTKHHKQVSGPTDFTSLTGILASMQTVGFQAAHYAKAGRLMAQMLQQQPPSKIFAIQDGNFVEVPPAATPEATTLESGSHEPEKIYPNIFLGMTANLLGTGCREGLRFLVEEGVRPRTVAATPAEAAETETDFERLIRQLVQSEGLPSRCMALRGDHHSFLAALVVSGGGMEHDLRRACQPYTLTHYRSEAEANVGTSSSTSSKDVHFGNISYTDDVAQHHHDLHHSAKTSYPSSCLFSILMRLFVGRLMARQERLRAEYRRTNTSGAAADVGTVCPWAIAPCEVWALAGLWLVDLLTEALMEHHAATSAFDAMDETLRTRLATEAEARARTTITYWAAHKAVPVFSPSIADGDLITFVLQHTAAHPGSSSLKLDLVRDIHHINKLAMLSQCTGMIICGGGVVKHHVCNANLMRNGADYTVILSTGQEFDGSDAGARPEEAISWGKVRIDGQSVKVYGEVTTMFPMLIAQVFVEAVRQRRAEAAATISTTE